MDSVIKLSSPDTHEYWEIPVLFEDPHLLALDKPARLLTSPDRYDPERPNLMRLLHRDIARGARWAKERGITYLANAHRLDFETSGIILLARSKPVLTALADQFGAEKPLKTYVALAQGNAPEDAFVVDRPIGSHPARPGIMRIDPKLGKRARTQFEVLERFRQHTLLRARPATGRTHQIRVHLRHAGLPIAGDALYGGSPVRLSELKPGYRHKPDQEERPLIGRVALHADSLTLPHPALGPSVAITSPWPKDLEVALKYLRRYAGPVGP